MKTKSEVSASHCRYVITKEDRTESRLLVVGNCHLELMEEDRFQILRVLRKDGRREHHEIYRQFLAGSREIDWAVEIAHPEAAMWATRLQGFQGILQLLIPVVKPYEQRDTYTHRVFRVSAEDDVLRLDPQEVVPFHPVIREQDNLHGLIREIVRGTRLRVTTILDKDEWVAGIFRVWDGLYMGNNNVGMAPTEAEALGKLDEHVKERLHSASRAAGYSDEEKAAFRELHENWVTPQPSGEWPR